MEENDLSELLDFIARRGRFGFIGGSIVTHPTGDDNNRKLHAACEELERRDQIRRHHVSEDGACVVWKATVEPDDDPEAGKARSVLEREATLEVLCQVCNGTGSTDMGQKRRCRRCNGAGYIPTEVGEKVLALMRHNFKPMLQDAQDD